MGLLATANDVSFLHVTTLLSLRLVDIQQDLIHTALGIVDKVLVASFPPWGVKVYAAGDQRMESIVLHSVLTRAGRSLERVINHVTDRLFDSSQCPPNVFVNVELSNHKLIMGDAGRPSKAAYEQVVSQSFCLWASYFDSVKSTHHSFHLVVSI
ncbi:hypothetical protein BDV59DRAFT_30472 [Aspergillus ambiguus]|uniref:uncharacterized protein n=1 Tax=Aspergillus ambiguus TaxID=176160 RepID=UPI003CCD9737